VPGTVPLPRTEDEGVMAEVLWIDRYGNCQLNVGPDDLASLASAGDRLRLEIGLPTDPSGIVTRVAERADAFAGIAGGGLGLVLDSYGMLALSINRGSAADHLGVGVGDQVFVTGYDDGATRGDERGPVATPVRLSRP
jgi:S-adenosylmethionine hydrolase